MFPIRLALLLGATLLVPAASAQEFSVYTAVFDMSSSAGETSRTPLVRSLSLFHAGSAYDYVESDRDGEVIIFEPAAQRFRILNPGRSIWSAVHFDQLAHKLKFARQITERHLADLQEHQPASPEVAELTFVLNPSFHDSFDAGRHQLTLASPLVTYRATCAQSDGGQPPPELVEAYLRYADAIARMNYVLHPHALGPEPRVALNAALRTRQLIPVDVELQSRVGGARRLRAEHKYRWTLEARDRSLIHEWETLLSSDQVRQVTLDEYQRTLLAAPVDEME
jgi:hypothetical protein